MPALTGVSATTAVGSVGGGISQALAGVAAAVSLGSFGTDLSTAVAGVSSASSIGTLTAYQDYVIPSAEINRDGLRQRLPHISTKVLNADGTMNPDWYRALSYLQDVRLGGVDGPTLTGLLLLLTATQAQAASIAAVTDQLLQQ